jgi:hypothetical protein
MSQHLMNRLNIAREDQTVRDSIPVSSFRSNLQARQEMAMRQMLGIRRAAGIRESGPAPAESGSYSGMAGRGAGVLRPSGGAGAGGGAGGSGTGSRQPALRTAALSKVSPMPVSAGPAMPFVYRRAAFDIQIADPASSDLLMLDRGTWVLSASEPHPVTNMLRVFTTDQDTGKVLVYELPIPEGNMAKFFDRHTLNVVETMAVDEEVEEGQEATSGYE